MFLTHLNTFLGVVSSVVSIASLTVNWLNRAHLIDLKKILGSK
jgi:hypothetical protein